MSKIKVRPEDFVVRERLTLPPLAESGPYAIFNIRKTGLTTLDAVRILSRRWGLPASVFRYAGLKDKYGVTEQSVSVPGSWFRVPGCKPGENEKGEAEGRHDGGLECRFVGYAERPVGPDLLEGNEFEITVRDVPRMEAEKLSNAYTEILNFGFINYFGEQRFGSARAGRGFFARELARGQPEAALKLYLATWDRKERSRLKAFKKKISSHWGDWSACLKGSVRSTEQSIILYLRNHPQDFMGAINRIPRNLLSLFISAYQSYLWNETVRRSMAALYAGRIVFSPFRNDTVDWLFYRTMPDSLFEELKNIVISLMNKQVKHANPRVAEIEDGLLAEEGVTRNHLGLKGVRGAYFKSVPRRVVVVPEDFEIDPPVKDELYEGRTKVRLRFRLPPGSYATVLLRRMLA